MLTVFLFWSLILLKLISALTIKGQLDVTPYNLSTFKISNTRFRLQQIGSLDSNKHPIKATAYIQDPDGSFEFNNIEVDEGINKTTQFIIYPLSKDFNMKPNRVLVEFFMNENGTLETKGFRNYFGREYFPSKDIKFPEKLDPIDIKPMIRFSLVQKQPFRNYLQVRNPGVLKSGMIASILHSPWKMALVLIALTVIIFPIYVENFDPETVKLMKEQRQKQQREKYQIPN